MRTTGPPALDYHGIDARTRDEAGRRALVAIAARDLLLSVEAGSPRGRGINATDAGGAGPLQ